MPSARDRRASVRHVPRRPAPACDVEVPEKEERWSAVVLDVSATGFGLLIDRPFPAGTILEVDLEESTGAVRTVTMRVVRVTPHGVGHWVLGCTVEGRLEKAELESFL